MVACLHADFISSIVIHLRVKDRRGEELVGVHPFELSGYSFPCDSTDEKVCPLRGKQRKGRKVRQLPCHNADWFTVRAFDRRILLLFHSSS